MRLWIICVASSKKEQMFEVTLPLYNEKKCFLGYLNFIIFGVHFWFYFSLCLVYLIQKSCQDIP